MHLLSVHLWNVELLHTDDGVCGLVPSLSLLKDAHVHGCLNAGFFDKLLDCLEPRANLAGIYFVNLYLLWFDVYIATSCSCSSCCSHTSQY